MSIKNNPFNINENLLSLISEVDSQLADISCISQLAAPDMNRRSYLLKFANGNILKGRVFESEYDAYKICVLWKYLNSDYFPKLLSIRRNAALIEWINGGTLSDSISDISLDLFRLCGDIQGIVHMTRIDDNTKEKCTKYTALDVSESIQFTKIQLGDLMKFRVLDKEALEILSDYIQSCAPDKFTTGLVLGDFCPENIVLNEFGNIYIIDNEKLSIDAYDYDLARTFYRWPMSSEQKKAYIEGYELHRSYESFRKYFSFWMIRVLIKSLLFRLQSGSILYKEPLNKLKLILSDFLCMKEPDIDTFCRC